MAFSTRAGGCVRVRSVRCRRSFRISASTATPVVLTATARGLMSSRVVRVLKADVGRVHRANFGLCGIGTVWRQLRPEGACAGPGPSGQIDARAELGVRGPRQGRAHHRAREDEGAVGRAGRARLLRRQPLNRPLGGIHLSGPIGPRLQAVLSPALLGGQHYPRSVGEFMAWFQTDTDCLDYLEWLRWPTGFICPNFGGDRGWRLGDGRWQCRACRSRTSATAGTIFDRTRTPLTVWFTACWHFAIQKDGVSAMSLQRTLEIGSYQTAWAMLHRLRSVLIRPGRERLSGEVEVDEAYFGGEEPGLRDGRARGKKTLAGIAIERSRPKGFGRCRMAILRSVSTESLRKLLADNVEEGATVITDGWAPYQLATAGLYTHQQLVGSGRQAPQLLPGVHRVSALAKRWLLGTHQGSVDDAHLASYLNEFVFRFNRRRSRSRGLVFYRVLELGGGARPGALRRPGHESTGQEASANSAGHIRASPKPGSATGCSPLEEYPLDLQVRLSGYPQPANPRPARCPRKRAGLAG